MNQRLSPITPPPPDERVGAIQRRMLEQQIRTVRRRIITASIVGTTLFSTLAGYQTLRASTLAATATTPAIVQDDAATAQATNASIFDNQGTVALAAATPTAAATSTATATTTASAATLAPTATATAVPTATATTAPTATATTAPTATATTTTKTTTTRGKTASS